MIPERLRAQGRCGAIGGRVASVSRAMHDPYTGVNETPYPTRRPIVLARRSSNRTPLAVGCGRYGRVRAPVQAASTRPPQLEAIRTLTRPWLSKSAISCFRSSKLGAIG
jgi:hypothetical protein